MNKNSSKRKISLQFFIAERKVICFLEHTSLSKYHLHDCIVFFSSQGEKVWTSEIEKCIFESENFANCLMHHTSSPVTAFHGHIFQLS